MFRFTAYHVANVSMLFWLSEGLKWDFQSRSGGNSGQNISASMGDIIRGTVLVAMVHWFQCYQKHEK